MKQEIVTHNKEKKSIIGINLEMAVLMELSRTAFKTMILNMFEDFFKKSIT